MSSVLEREEDFFNSRGIAPYTKKVVKRIISNPSPCLLVAPTGYGKSVAVPYAIVRAGYKVMIALPTNALCDNLYNNFKEVYPSLIVGKAYERDINIPRGAQIIVVSNGYLRNRLLGFVRDGVCHPIDSNVADVLFLDEVHLNKLDMSVTVSLWFYCSSFNNGSSGGPRFPRLVLSSATPGKIIFGRKIELCVTIPPQLFKTVYNIEEHWHPTDFPAKSPLRYKAMGELLKTIHENTPVTERVIVFVPGKGEEMDQVIKSSGLENEVEFLKIMSGTTQEEHDKLRNDVDTKRIVVLSTPSGDAGLNIRNLVHVLDSMLIKNNVETPNGSVELETSFISKALAKQRRGRVGRNKDGHYYPFCTQEGYERLEEDYPSEIHKLPLYRTILELNAHGLEIDNVLGIYKIPRLKKDIEDLVKWGLLRRSTVSGSLYSSAAGVFISKLEIESPKLGTILYGWSAMGWDLVPGIILVNVISFVTREVFDRPTIDDQTISSGERIRRINEFSKTYHSRFLGRTEVHTAVNVWNTAMLEGGLNSLINLESWCDANHLNFRMLRTLVKTIEKACNELGVESSFQQITRTHLANVRTLFGYIYRDSVATRSSSNTATFVISSSSEVVEVSGTSGFNQYSERSEIPAKIVVIAKRQTRKGATSVVQSLDLDRLDEITEVSNGELIERLGVFM